MTLEMRDSSQREQLLASAANWVLRLRDPAVSPAEISGWMAWCDASAKNQQAFSEMQLLWEGMENVAPKPISPAALARDNYQGDVSVTAWRSVASSAASTQLLSRMRWKHMSVAAAAASLILGLSWFAMNGLHTRDVVVVTEIGRNDKLHLPDGSLAIVAGGSRMTTHYSGKERTVFLERGEAFFEAKKDINRPFVVHALDSKVTAIGTAFNVRAEQGIVRVAVTEGSVDVRRHESASVASESPQLEKIRLDAGEQVTLLHGEPRPPVLPVDPQEATSWVSGTLRFVNEPLALVVAAVNRYSPTPVEIVGNELGGYLYTGTVIASRVDEWLRGLPEAFPIVVRKAQGPGTHGESLRYELALTGSNAVQRQSPR